MAVCAGKPGCSEVSPNDWDTTFILYALLQGDSLLRETE